MNTLSLSELSSVNGGFWKEFGCIAGVTGYVVSIAGLVVFSGGTAAALALAGFHILDSISAGVSCAVWLAS